MYIYVHVDLLFFQLGKNVLERSANLYTIIFISQNANHVRQTSVLATARNSYDLVLWQRLPLLTIQQTDFLLQVTKSPQ